MAPGHHATASPPSLGKSIFLSYVVRVTLHLRDQLCTEIVLIGRGVKEGC